MVHRFYHWRNWWVVSFRSVSYRKGLRVLCNFWENHLIITLLDKWVVFDQHLSFHHLLKSCTANPLSVRSQNCPNEKVSMLAIIQHQNTWIIKLVAGHLNPRIFNPGFFNHKLFNHHQVFDPMGLKSPGLKSTATN